MENAEAGPSGTSYTNNNDRHREPYEPAPLLPLPSTTYYSLEYPGILRSPSSIPQALKTLGGQEALDAAFRRDSAYRPIELWFRPGEVFSHPVQGEVVDFRGIVMKVTKRRRKRKRGEDAEMNGDVQPADGTAKENSTEEDGGVYTTEAIGISRKVARFRAMADFSYLPPETDRIVSLRRAMDSLDDRAIVSFEMQPEKEDYVLYPPGSSSVEPASTPGTPVRGSSAKPGSADPAGSGPTPISNMRLFPPPRFTKTAVPLLYNFRQNVSSRPQTYIDPRTGEERTRYVNKHRHDQESVITITFNAPEEDVPKEAPEGAEKLDRHLSGLLQKVLKFFDDRPIWSRLALRNQLSLAEDTMLVNNRLLFAYVGYMFDDGPWRDFPIRFGYDPRKHPEARIYQRLQFRNVENDYSRPAALVLHHPSSSSSARDPTEPRNTRNPPLQRSRTSHVFDGQVLHRYVGNYQLCDMTDPLLQRLIMDPKGVGRECHPITGWYTQEAWDRIRAVARRKFTSLLDGHPLPDSACADLLSDQPLQKDAAKVELRRLHELEKLRELNRSGRVARPKGHNLAVEPGLPEEEAARRIRRRLEAVRGREVRGDGVGEDEDEEME